MILVSELVLTRNQLLEITRHQEDATVKAPLQRLSSLTTDLQDAVMRARMQPVGRLFASLPRLVRELAVELKKKLYLVTEGADTELDRQLIEIIRDPLTHLLRNCADHGIELPDRRLALGKPEEGTIRVAATHEAGYITIDVSDDGRGLDLERIRYKALAKGLVNATEAKESFRRRSRPVHFRSGFLDFAKRHQHFRARHRHGHRARQYRVDRRIDLAHDHGRKGHAVFAEDSAHLGDRAGADRRRRAAIISLCRNTRVIEAVRIDAESSHSLERIQGSLVLRLRDEVLPVADLESVLDLEANRRRASGALVIVMRVNSRTFGITVDSVTRRPGNRRQAARRFALASRGLFRPHNTRRRLRGPDPRSDRNRRPSSGFERASDYTVGRTVEAFVPAEENTRFVLFRAGPGAPKALPLSLVARIESVPASEIHRSDGIIRHAASRPADAARAALFLADQALLDESNPVLVLGIGGESMGLLDRRDRRCRRSAS